MKTIVHFFIVLLKLLRIIERKPVEVKKDITSAVFYPDDDWNSVDIENVIKILEAHPAVIYRKILFLTTSVNESDHLLQYLYPMNHGSGLANTTLLIREILAKSHAQHPSDIIDFILNNTTEETKLITTIVLSKSLFAEDIRYQLPFIVAHEIGHVVQGDLSAVEVPPPGSDEYLRIEMAADQYANRLLGSNEASIALLTRYRDLMNLQVDQHSPHFTHEMLRKGVDIIEARLKAVQQNQ